MDLPRYHRLRSAYYRLEGQRCPGCGDLHFPPRPSCSRCGHEELEPFRFCGRGEVFSYSVVAMAPKGFLAPYVVAMVELEEGVMVTAQLTDVEPEDVAIGLPVEMVTRRLQDAEDEGYIVYGYKFRPRLADGAWRQAS